MSRRSAIVLVHGAFQSSATWDLVAAALREAGCHPVVASLTGLAPGGRGLTEQVDLDTHVRDVVSLIESGDLRQVVLVGHSYAGMVVTGVAERIPDRLAHLVYVDAFVPRNGESAWDLMPERTRGLFRDLAAGAGGWRLPKTDRLLDLWGLEPRTAERTFVEARLCDFSLHCFQQPLDAPQYTAGRLPRTYVASGKPSYPARAVFAPFAAQARGAGWPVHELETGHDCQAEEPEALAAILAGIGAAPAGPPGRRA